MLLQIATAFLLQSATRFITNCDRYYKVRWIYYNLRQVLQSSIIITNCDSKYSVPFHSCPMVLEDGQGSEIVVSHWIKNSRSLLSSSSSQDNFHAQNTNHHFKTIQYRVQSLASKNSKKVNYYDLKQSIGYKV